METITFKLSDDLALLLQQRGERWHGISHHRFAKEIVINYLQDTERNRIRQDLAGLKRDVACVRQELATAVYLLLLRGGKVSGTQEAKELVERYFPSNQSS